MAYKCPRCGEPVTRGYSSSAQAIAGIVGALFYAAFGAFECRKCGKIAHSEFPQEVRTEIVGVSLLLIACAIAITIGALSASSIEAQISEPVIRTGQGVQEFCLTDTVFSLCVKGGALHHINQPAYSFFGRDDNRLGMGVSLTLQQKQPVNPGFRLPAS